MGETKYDDNWFNDEWYNLMVNLASREPEMREVAHFALYGGLDMEKPRLEMIGRRVCREYTLNFETDLVDIVECYADQRREVKSRDQA